MGIHLADIFLSVWESLFEKYYRFMSCSIILFVSKVNYFLHVFKKKIDDQDHHKHDFQNKDNYRKLLKSYWKQPVFIENRKMHGLPWLSDSGALDTAWSICICVWPHISLPFVACTLVSFPHIFFLVLFMSMWKICLVRAMAIYYLITWTSMTEEGEEKKPARHLCKSYGARSFWSL